MNRTRIYPAFLLLLAAALLHAQPRTATISDTARQQRTAVQTLAAITPDDPIGVSIHHLKNGLTVMMSVNRATPRIQTLIATRAGSKNDPADNTGLAHYLEHMLFKGTDRFGTLDYAKEKPLLDEIENLYETYDHTTDPTARKAIYHRIDSVSGLAAHFAIANEYDKLLGSIGAHGTNAFTWFEQTVYENDIPANELDRFLTIEAERFRNPVMRLFHTELEAVYEEKNISLDNDDDKSTDAAMGALFRNHAYGTQTTIGTVEHLRNPSLKKIREYYRQNYVPNNMAIILAGDFDPDQALALIEKRFGSMVPHDAPPYTFAPETPRNAPVALSVYGPDAENVRIGYRFPGAGTRDALLLELSDMLLAYKKAGLIDVNLRQKQRLLEASSSPWVLKDYSVEFLTGTPKEGQSLEQVRDLLLEQVGHLKRGEFDESMLKGIIENMKEDRIRSYETDAGRAYTMLDAFTLGIDWENYAAKIRQMEGVSKQELVDFANRYYGNDYVVVYKRQGDDSTVTKVEKPQITPVEMNRDAQSEFLRTVLATPTPKISPVFLDYNKDITTLTLKSGLPVYYMQNRENHLFSLYYVLDMGKANDRKLPFALSYLPYLGTGRLSAEELNREFFKLGCEFGVSSDEDQVYVYLTGLEENFEPGLKLFEEMLAGVKPDKEALDKLVERELKSRSDAKLDKDEILWSGLRNYAIYGPRNPFTDRLSARELKSLKPEELVDRIHSLLGYRHEVLYYGPRTGQGIVTALDSYHPAPAAFKPYPAATVYPRLDIDKPVVYFVDYDMVQAEILWLRKSSPFQADLIPAASLFNEYYGGNMSGIVFQTIRESRALAYGSFSSYQTPERRSDPFYIVGYIGTQADKLNDAIGAMNDLLTTMPRADKTFSAAREGLKSRLETGRIIRTDALFDYLAARKLGLDHDIRRDTYAKLETMTLDDLARFHDVRYANVPYAYCIIGSKEHIKRSDLEKYGKVVELKLSDIFGY